jgi:hypothetical protein
MQSIDFERLLYAILYGRPFFDGGLSGGSHHPLADLSIVNENPTWPGVNLPPPRRLGGGPLFFLVSALSLKIAAAKMSNPELRSGLEGSITQAIEKALDEYCGTPPGFWPPGPPPPLSYALAAELTWVANTLQEGALQSAVSELATRVLEKASARSLASRA